MATSYNGWKASRDPSAIGIDEDWEPVKGHKFPGGIKSGDVETVMTYLVRALHNYVEPIDETASKDEWGWFYKPSANDPTKLSCHSSGTAFDYNATQHPNGVPASRTWTKDQIAAIRRILAFIGCVYWGADRGTPDAMHFEVKYVGSGGSAADVHAAAQKIRAATAPLPPAAIPAPKPPEDDDMPLIITATDRGPRLLDAPFFVPLDAASVKNFTAAGVKTVNVTAGDYDETRQQCLKALGLG